jgi:glycerol kinase
MAEGCILALDQGTSGSAAMLFSAEGQILAAADRPLTLTYPQPGWVDQDAEQILRVTREAASAVLGEAGMSWRDLRAVGITNQRETTVVWETRSGKPVAPAIVWQCRRTAEICAELKRSGWTERVRSATGLPIDPYFSGTKIRWLLDRIPDGQRRAEAGDLLFGTIDSWLIWNLTERRVHATDYTNASRTMLFNIHTRAWDADLLGMLNIPAAILPEVRTSSGLFGHLPEGPAILGVAGDQQAALFGQAGYDAGECKNTYGTGAFMVMNAGEEAIRSERGLLTTLAVSGDGAPCYALEGSVFTAGAVVQWLRDGVGLIAGAEESEALAMSVPDTAGVTFVPAFVGLGSPYWDPRARGSIFGLTAGANRAHIVRAALESIAYQSAELLGAMAADAGSSLAALRVDGGGSANAFTMQFQADLIGLPVERPVIRETTALGAAYLAGLAAGFWPDSGALRKRWKLDRRFEPRIDQARREELMATWRRAVSRSLEWAS